jgi:ABC-type multidrug transport system ATPase subunit
VPKAPPRTTATPRPAAGRSSAARTRAAAEGEAEAVAGTPGESAPKKPTARATPKKPTPKKPAPRAVPKKPVAGPEAGATAARATAARAPAARTAAAKSESVAKTGAARSTAAKASAAKAAATRAATLAAAAAAAAATEPEPEPVEPETVAPEPVEPEPVESEIVAPDPEPDTPDLPELIPAPVEEAEPVLAAPVSKKRPVKRAPRKRAPVIAPAAVDPAAPVVLAVSGLRKSFGRTVAVSGIDLKVRAGSFFGIVGPNGAGKTTTLSMVTGLLRPDAGTVTVNGIDVWGSPIAAKRVIGVLPDRLRLFDRLTGAQLLYYSGVLRGLDDVTVRKRAADLATAFGLEDALNRLVADYSAGMTKKIALACAMIHSPRLLVLDEPFESVDPVSAVNVTEILQKYVASGGTVVLSSHGMDLIQRVCDHVAIIVQGAVLASGTIDEVRGEKTLEERFIELAGGRTVAEGMEWLHSFSD